MNFNLAPKPPALPDFSSLIKSFLLVLIINLPAQLFGQSSGTLDLTFNANDLGQGGGAGLNGTVYASAIQADEKIVIAGVFTLLNRTSRNGITRLNADGSNDFSFNPGGGTDNAIRAVAIQSNGRILIGGIFTSYNGTNCNRITRLLSDGSIDNSFNPGIGANSDVRTIAVQSDGKIIIGGFFTSINNVSTNSIARLNVDGSVDNTFNVGGTGFNSNVNCIVIQPDNKILVAGGFTTYNGVTNNKIIRLNSDGTADNTFSSGAGATVGAGPSAQIYSMARQSDGNILIGGSFTGYDGTARSHIARVTVTGSIDATFDPGTGATDDVYAIAVQSDNKIMIGGWFLKYNGTTVSYSARLSSAGALDNSFTHPQIDDRLIRTMAIQSDGKIFFGSEQTFGVPSTNTVFRLTSTGGSDAFGNPVPLSGANDDIFTSFKQADGKIIISGAFIAYDGVTRKYIARINENGALDASFDPSTSLNNIVYGIAEQAGGKIIIAGAFTTYQGNTRNYIARLNSDGSHDATFNPGTGADNVIHEIIMQADEKIIIVGNFTTFDGTSRNKIARLNANGSLDATFDPGTGVDNNGAVVEDVDLLPDGKVMIAGFFSSYNGTARNSLARINSNGSLDLTFDPGAGTPFGVNEIAIQPDNKLLIGGEFNSFSGVNRNRIARLNANGSVDTSFDPGNGFNSEVTSIHLLSNGTILVGGLFKTFNGVSRNGIASLTSTGSLNTSFNPGVGTNNRVIEIISQSPNRIILVGFFTAYNNIGRSYIARVKVTDQYITFPTISSKVFGGPSFDLTATASSGLAVSYTSTSPHITILGSAVTMVTPGSVTIDADQAGNSNFDPALEVSQTFCIQPAKPAITAEDLQLSSSSASGNQWFRNGSAIVNATNQTFIASVTGVYTVQVDVEGCKSEISDGESITITGETPALSFQAVEAYPNPTTGIIGINLETIAINRPVKIRIVDALGTEVYDVKENGGTIIPCDLSGYTKGIYVLKITDASRIYYAKVIKQ